MPLIGILLIVLYFWLIYLFFVFVYPIAVLVGTVVASIWMVTSFFRAVMLLCGGSLPAAVGDAPSGSEPAYKQYFFRRAFLDLRDVLAQNIEFNRQALEQASSRAKLCLVGKNKEYALLLFSWPLAVAFFTVGVVALLVAVAINVAFALLFAGIVFACVSANAVTMLILKSLERTVLAIRGFANHCPKCYHKFLLPVYECGVCHARHRKLFPSSYGIFHRKCTCGTYLPTSYLLDRHRLDSFCPSCDHRLEGEDPTMRPVLVPVIAGRSAGKTVFHVALLQKLLERQSTHHCKLSFVVPNDEREYQTALSMFSCGQVLPQTLARVPKALQLNYILPKEFAPDTRLLLFANRDVRLKLLMYDAAGEAYEEDRHFEQLTFIEHCTGIIMLIDPFSIPAVRDSLSGSLNSVSPSDASPDDVYARLVEFLEQHEIRRGTRQVKIPLAVVVTKCDAFGLDGLLGLPAVRKAQEDENRRAQTEHRPPGVVTMSLLVRYWLCRWNLTNFINNIESHFAECQYFSCSAFGRVPSPKNNTPFVPRGVESPFEWILDAAGVAEFPATLAQHTQPQQRQRTSV